MHTGMLRGLCVCFRIPFGEACPLARTKDVILERSSSQNPCRTRKFSLSRHLASFLLPELATTHQDIGSYVSYATPDPRQRAREQILVAPKS